MHPPNFPMPHGYEWQYEVLTWLQSFHNPVFERVMRHISLYSGDQLYLLVLPILFWAFDRQIGFRIMYVFVTSVYLNVELKDLLRITRPIGVPGIKSLQVNTAPGYSLPSGHAQLAMTFFVLLSQWLRRWWMWFAAFAAAFAIGFSRLYLGLHWPLDVFAGWVTGLVVALIGWWFGRFWVYRHYAFTTQMMVAVAIPVLLFAVRSGNQAGQYAALMLALGVGRLLEHKHLHLAMEKGVFKRICAAIIGTAGLIALQWIFKGWSSVPYVLVGRDVLLGLWATIGAPYLFMLCGLYRKEAMSD